ncbi:hypothetical protein AWM70_20275 [Paenibacillus yonginensis]|uniref:DUF2334 domain-containing protein n=1 Tax=Paenibacillus yonginensis TaxID=1462996 RepID=A0A1B1N5D4_9BACL|nr:DUF2334 domain-containing protein [Paenibacillus yonginensis]ANS76626.1 hypothetical protein AWM70_20275 [Paenibacillus yonginensis]
MNRNGNSIKVVQLLLLTLLLLPNVWPEFSAKAESAPAAAASSAEAAASEVPAESPVLLVYDSLGAGTPQQGGIAALDRLIAAFGAAAEQVSLDDYKAGMLQGFGKVIRVVNLEPGTAGLEQEGQSAFLQDLQSYTGDVLQIGGQPPEPERSRLGIKTNIARQQPVHLTAAGGLDTTFNVKQMIYMTAGTGETYGSLTLESVQGHFPYSLQSGHYTYVPYFEAGSGNMQVMAGVLKHWFRQDRPGRAYLLIKEIYPFSDLSLLETMADKLYQAGIPFIASVRPVFSHTEYPAMQRYLETIKYLQARGGSILVHVPEVLAGVQSRKDELYADMEGFIDLLINAEVAPLGVGAEQYWAHDGEYTGKGLSFFDSSVLFPDVKAVPKEPLPVQRSFRSALFSVTMEDLRQSYGDSPVQELPVNTAVTYDFPDRADGLTALLEELKASWVTLADYKDLDHEVKTQSHVAQSRKGAVILNGETLNPNYSGSKVSRDYEYVQHAKTSFRKLFQVQNTFFMVIIAFSLIVFGGLLLVGRRLYRRKFLKRDSESSSG